MMRRDDGRVTIFFAIMAPAWFALLGLVFVGGNRIIALQRADNIASEAARAAGQAINAPEAIVGGAKVVDPDAAAAAAQAYIAAAGAKAVSLIIADDRQHLTITVQVTYNPGSFAFFAGSWTVEAKATATLVVT
jgi:Flp pilus assembly protein TadG